MKLSNQLIVCLLVVWIIVSVGQFYIITENMPTGRATTALVKTRVIESIFPNIVSYSIYPPAGITGEENVTLDMHAIDNAKVDKMWAVVTLPNATTELVTTFPYYIAPVDGRYNVTFYANDTSGNLASMEDFFLAAPGFDFTIYVKDHAEEGVATTLVLYITGTDKNWHGLDFIGTLIGRRPNILYDMLFIVYDGSIKLRLNNVNFSHYNNNTLRIDKAPLTGKFVVIYGVESEFHQESADLTISYNNTPYTNEDYLGMYKCADWNFAAQICVGTWQDLNATQDKVTDTFAITLIDLSGFAIKQEGYCGDGVWDVGETLENCPEDYPLPPLIPKRKVPPHIATCYDGIQNKDETDIDCGGVCEPCPDEKKCIIDSDCISQNCYERLCQAATCFDSIQNQNETDIDCGGVCNPCVKVEKPLVRTLAKIYTEPMTLFLLITLILINIIVIAIHYIRKKD